MKEILIPTVAIMLIFGLPIFKMMADIITTFIEKPRWKVQSIRVEVDLPCPNGTASLSSQLGCSLSDREGLFFLS